ncbi:hypothetical protein CTA2_9092 [Colletotrichum tanaceti]|uniref:Uncharacterized protein n=1 Tax=Colletotrichum tanaceti TaxID=1306861 RepID=A0A4U6X0A5_9PEZI|nr:hypothetical protein CTA2_9092 [Colletotrichum tanaceti]TKW48424.1 hypothetical protein CTA1_8895 [Colletotrichum tanaceti]
MAEENVGAVVALSPPAEGDNIWEAKQVEVASNLPPGDGQGRISIDWSFGPVKVTGYVDTDTFEIGLTVSIAGITVGDIFGNLKDGVGLKIDLLAAKGEIRFYLKNGNEVWIHLDVKIVFDGHYEGDYKIVSI